MTTRQRKQQLANVQANRCRYCNEPIHKAQRCIKHYQAELDRNKARYHARKSLD